jgi:hypothetical protein
VLKKKKKKKEKEKEKSRKKRRKKEEEEENVDLLGDVSFPSRSLPQPRGPFAVANRLCDRNDSPRFD